MSYSLHGLTLSTPLKLKRRTVGEYSITTEKIKSGTNVDVISARNAIIGGLGRPTSMRFDQDLIVHKLSHKKGIWTTDSPQELYTQQAAFKEVHGHVLVGGLGIGMAALLIAKMPRVTKVTVVEIAQDVISLVEPQLPKTPKMQIVNADLYEYLTHCGDFDSAYFDTWAPTGERVWDEEVVPLRRLVLKHHGEKLVTCWLESEMHGQVRMALHENSVKCYREMAFKEPAMFEKWKQHCRINGVFFNVMDLRPSREHKQLLDLYCLGVGTKLWERVFGAAWDSWKREVRC